MWIRSQDKLCLMRVDAFPIINHDEGERLWSIIGIGKIQYKLGSYKSEERAIEVLDEIKRLIEDLKYMEYAIDKNKFCGYRSNVYQMPEE